ncbi:MULTISPECIES: hypothetical protein [unclassified Nocardioides]|uniref:hypothetical protein n=1 Tax=unclassified Nocardioides TaxID=2615069 RepID=UPI0036100856
MSLRPDTNAPAPLVVAASLAAIEGLLLLGYAVLEVVSLDADRVEVALTTTAFFALYGGGLLYCAWALTRLSSWARSPVVLAQLIQLGVAWSFWGGETTVVAIVVGLVAIVVLVGVLHPASMSALAAAED